MKKSIYFLLFMLFIATACLEPPIVFEEAQPADASAAEQINWLYHGSYLCESDSAIVYVNKHTIYKEKDYQFTLTKDDVMTIEELTLRDGQLYFEDHPTPLPTTINGDTISSEINFKDTLFSMGAQQVLKVYKGHQILSKELGLRKWEVNILSLDEDRNLRLFSAAMPKDIEMLNKVTPVKDITTEKQIQYSIKPTKMAFDEILKQDLVFEECDVFIRKEIDKEL